MEFLSSGWGVFLALAGFGFVIFIHELGHFVFAKWAGVRVDRFSIGFGPVILRKRIGETEYALSLLPLGGYVKMLGQEDLPTEVGTEAKVDPRSYLAKSWQWQALILLGGVLFNLISSYLILICIAWHGKTIIEPVVGDVRPSTIDERGRPQPSPALRLGLHRGDRILTINGQQVREFEDVTMTVITSSGERISLEVQRGGERLRLPAEGAGELALPNFSLGRLELGAEPAAGLGIDEVINPFGELPADAPRAGERLVAIAGQRLPEGTTGQEAADLLMPHLGQEIELGLASSAGERTVTVRYGGQSDLSFGFPVRIRRVEPGGAADLAGIRAGDLALTVDGQPVASVSGFIALTRAALNADREMKVVVQRGDQEVAIAVRGSDLRGRRLLGAEPELVMGFLPVVPLAWDGKPSALGAAGLKPGDALITAPEPVRGAKALIPPVECAVVSGGAQVTVPLGDDDYYVLIKGSPPSRLAKLFGGIGDPSLLSRLAGRKVVSLSANGGSLVLRDRDGLEAAVELSRLSQAGGKALAEGLKPGDWVIGTLTTAGGFALEAVRGAGEPRSVTLTPRDSGMLILTDRYLTGVYRLGAWTEAFSIANRAAYNMVVKTLQIIPKFFQSTANGGLDPNKSLTGPIGIFRMLKVSAEKWGFVKFLEFTALIGLNLFLVNLLPIPITDGGQLVFLAIETATGRPMSALVRNLATWVGLLMVVGLMLYVVGLDVLRLFGLM
jgi:membrane-associated protease RseP (regulator of RpoE activity)